MGIATRFNTTKTPSGIVFGGQNADQWLVSPHPLRYYGMNYRAGAGGGSREISRDKSTNISNSKNVIVPYLIKHYIYTCIAQMIFHRDL